jgi:hypothetical protein
VKFVLKLKLHPDGSVARYKARLVALGFMHRVGIDCGDTYAPVSRYSTLRFLIAHCTAMKFAITHLDVKTAFLNVDLVEEVWISEPPGVVGIPGHASKLHKALYGLKQAPRAWAQKLKATLIRIGFAQSTPDQCLYVMTLPNGQKIWCNTYVDDLFLAANPGPIKDRIIAELKAAFEIKDLGILSRPLGMELEHDTEKGTCTLHQAALIWDLLSDTNLLEANPRLLPMDSNEKFFPTPLTETPVPKEECNLAIVGSLLHLMNCTRPDIAQAVNVLCRYGSRPGPPHVAALKGVLRYLVGTQRLGITYSAGDSTIQGWCDADYAGDIKTSKSTTGYVFTCNHGAISWSSKLQPTVAQSTAEAEFMAAGAACKDALWWRKTLVDYSLPTQPISILTDNQSSLAIINNAATSNATKNIDIVHHATHDAVVDKKVSFDYTPTQVMAAGYRTKTMPYSKVQVMPKADWNASPDVMQLAS